MTHLYLQLLNHLHLDSALSGAAVIEGVLVVQVPEGEGIREEVADQFGLEWWKNANQINTTDGTGSSRFLLISPSRRGLHVA